MTMSGRQTSRAVVDWIRLHPKAAFIVLPIFLYVVYHGVSTGQEVANVSRDKPLTLVVEQVTNAAGRPIFPDFVASGTLESTNKPCTVKLYKQEFKKTKPGDRLNVYRTSEQSQTYVTQRRVEAAKIRFRVGSIPFNDAAIFGLAGSLACVGYGLLGKPGKPKIA